MDLWVFFLNLKRNLFSKKVLFISKMSLILVIRIEENPLCLEKDNKTLGKNEIKCLYKKNKSVYV